MTLGQADSWSMVTHRAAAEVVGTQRLVAGRTLYRSLFTDDAHIDYSAAGLTAGTRDEVADFLSQHQAGITMSMHYVTNIESQIHGDVAQVLAMWYNVVRLPETSQNSYFGGRWRHQMVRTSDGWRSRSLRLAVVWS
jgi:SnoaL-like domain